VAQSPFVDQRVGRAAIEAAHVSVRRENRDVADAAEVAHDARLVLFAEHGRVERRHERRALAARGDIAAAEIGDHVDAGHLSEQRGIVDLPCVAFVRPMPHRLSVHADRAHLRRRASAHALQFVAADGIACRERIRGERFAFEFVVAGRLQFEQRIAQAFGKGDMRLAEHDGRLARRELDRDTIDAVHAGSGHQTEVHAVRLAGFDCFGFLSHADLLVDADVANQRRLSALRGESLRRDSTLLSAECRAKPRDQTRKGANARVIA